MPRNTLCSSEEDFLEQIFDVWWNRRFLCKTISKEPADINQEYGYKREGRVEWYIIVTRQGQLQMSDTFTYKRGKEDLLMKGDKHKKRRLLKQFSIIEKKRHQVTWFSIRTWHCNATKGRIHQRNAQTGMKEKIRSRIGSISPLIAIYSSNKSAIIDCKFAISQYRLYPPR